MVSFPVVAFYSVCGCRLVIEPIGSHNRIDVTSLYLLLAFRLSGRHAYEADALQFEYYFSSMKNHIINFIIEPFGLRINHW